MARGETRKSGAQDLQINEILGVADPGNRRWVILGCRRRPIHARIERGRQRDDAPRMRGCCSTQHVVAGCHDIHAPAGGGELLSAPPRIMRRLTQATRLAHIDRVVEIKDPPRGKGGEQSRFDAG